MTTLCESCEFKRFPAVKIKSPEQQIKCEKFKLTSQKIECESYIKNEALSHNPLYKKLVKELEQLKEEGKDIYPADLGKKYNKFDR